MFFPLVVLVAVLPGLYALTSWDLTPPGPWWGLRGLAVLDGWLSTSARRGGDHAAAGGAGVPDGGVPAAALCLARGARPGAEPRPRPARHRPAQLRGGGPGGRAGLPAWPALARAGARADRGAPDRVQPRPAGPDAAGDADDPGAGRHAGRRCSATAGTSASRARRHSSSTSRPGAGAARSPGRSWAAWRWAWR